MLQEVAYFAISEAYYVLRERMSFKFLLENGMLRDALNPNPKYRILR